MSQVNEFAMNLPITSPDPSASIPAAAPGMTYVDLTPQDLPADVDHEKCDHISVSVDSAQVTNWDPASPTVMVDMVLSVNIYNQDGGSSSNYKMVKRLSMNKCKLACDAEYLSPVQVVEDDAAEVKAMMEAFYAARRAREIAGLVESNGKLKAKVLFSMKSKDGSATEGGQVVLAAVKDAAHARHVFGVQVGPKYKDRDLKITRVTMMKEGEE